MSDPSLLVTRPTATDPGLAPAGRQVLSVLAPCPNLATGHIDWDRVGPAYRAELGQALAARGLTGFDDAVEVERLVTPADWAAAGLAAGHPVLAGAHVPPDRPVPAPQPGPRRGERRARRAAAPPPASASRRS